MKTPHDKQLKFPVPETFNRHRPDGTYDKRPLDPNYFQKYYRNKLKTPYQCPDCGRTISSKSNIIYPSTNKQQNVRTTATISEQIKKPS